MSAGALEAVVVQDLAEGGGGFGGAEAGGLDFLVADRGDLLDGRLGFFVEVGADDVELDPDGQAEWIGDGPLRQRRAEGRHGGQTACPAQKYPACESTHLRVSIRVYCTSFRFPESRRIIVRRRNAPHLAATACGGCFVSLT